MKFLRETDIQAILNSAVKKPKGTKGGVRPDLPAKWAETRRDLYKNFVVPARKLKCPAGPVKVKWFQDQLELNGKKVTLNDSWTAVEQMLLKK